MDFGKMPFSDIFFFPWPSSLAMLCNFARAGLYIEQTAKSSLGRLTDLWPSLLGFPHVLLRGYTLSLVLHEYSPYAVIENIQYKILTDFADLACEIGAMSRL